MKPDLMRIEAALSTYPWTAGAFTVADRGAIRYCAIGMLLRYSGVSQEHIDVACNRGAVAFWEYYRPLLERDYGISGPEQIHAIMVANDGASSPGEAARRIRWVLSRPPMRPAEVLALFPVPPIDAPEDAAENAAEDACRSTDDGSRGEPRRPRRNAHAAGSRT